MRISIHATIESEDGASPSHEIQAKSLATPVLTQLPVSGSSTNCSTRQATRRSPQGSTNSGTATGAVSRSR